ncbi:DUF2207 domain-containing protein [Virgibacillus proomii]|uniref:DUF2207 domain-containing protein n=1 Tax=Virgibacillus proomii TaxID=84407 RepID=UPI001C113873|nr:DUF2207 domain-containing protein [Virgibacillus proomii]MBU5267450.1 DUF2207 domain-containing protein [Virgibacillus proomii]
MVKKLSLLVALLIGILMIPIPVLAVDYSIEQSKIDAYLQEDGEVQVTEQHTYQFDGKFNGITRTIIPKKGTSIYDMKASEKGRTLEVAQGGNEYKIYRGGKDERVTIQLTYIIKDSLKVYSDVAVFNWPFFDSSNESDYEQLDVFIHPPQKTEAVIAYGEDEAFSKEKMETGGVVHFSMGFVNSGEDGDILVAYDRALFPGVLLTEDKSMRENLLSIKRELVAKERAFVKRQSVLNDISPYVIGAFTIYLAGLLLLAWRKRHRKKLQLEQQYCSPYFLPKQEMSLPATIVYMSRGKMDAEIMTAALLDLEHKGYVKRDSHDTFTVVDYDTDHRHEAVLIDWLFYTVGKNGVFRTQDLKAYTKKKSNLDVYQRKMEDYKYAVKEEIDSHQLIDNKLGIRIPIGLSSLLILPFIIIFAIHGLYASMTLSIIYFSLLILFAIIYRPRTLKGARIFRQWKEFQEKYPQVASTDWDTLVDDEQKRAFIYGFGVNDKQIKEKNRELFQNHTPQANDTNADLIMMVLIASAINQQFDRANSTVAAASEAQAASSGAGTGIGGGGGGSGAF